MDETTKKALGVYSVLGIGVPQPSGPTVALYSGFDSSIPTVLNEEEPGYLSAVQVYDLALEALELWAEVLVKASNRTPDLLVSEAEAYRRSLETTIGRLLSAFEYRTGLCVGDVSRNLGTIGPAGSVRVGVSL
jgi:hypothetical protein